MLRTKFQKFDSILNFCKTLRWLPEIYLMQFDYFRHKQVCLNNTQNKKLLILKIIFLEILTEMQELFLVWIHIMDQNKLKVLGLTYHCKCDCFQIFRSRSNNHSLRDEDQCSRHWEQLHLPRHPNHSC